MNRLFALGDGDRIRAKIEGYLLHNQLDDLSSFSSNLALSIRDLAENAQKAFEAQIIMAGGDDVLLCMPSNKYKKETLCKLGDLFLAATGCSISFGVGSSISSAYLCLRMAKAKGDGLIVESQG